jgi:ubiquinone/menaquinone biosynthesis C-methylase UbiE
LEKQKAPVSSSLYTEEYFRTACEGFDVFNTSEGEQLSRRLSSAFALAEITPGMIILDVGCGRGEILRHAAQLGADAYGIDYAPVAVEMSRRVIDPLDGIAPGRTAVYLADAKKLPFPDACFDRVLMFDVVEHLHPWELDAALKEVDRVLKPDGRFIVHTAPNIWYDRYAYPIVRRVRTLMGRGENYPANPREFLVSVNEHVHVNEQSMWSLSRTLRTAGFKGKVWLESPPQYGGESFLIDTLRRLLFRTPPFRWFFEREVFAVVAKVNSRA